LAASCSVDFSLRFGMTRCEKAVFSC